MGGGSKGGGGAGGCLTRTPYATLLALIMCWVGSGIFSGSIHRSVVPTRVKRRETEYQLFRGITLTLSLLQQVFKVSDGLYW